MKPKRAPFSTDPSLLAGAAIDTAAVLSVLIGLLYGPLVALCCLSLIFAVALLRHRKERREPLGHVLRLFEKIIALVF